MQLQHELKQQNQATAIAIEFILLYNTVTVKVTKLLHK